MTASSARERSVDEGWPCQRLRVAFGLILFFFFEILIGKQLPQAFPILCLGIGAACLVSAMHAIHRWKLTARLALVMRALDQHA